MDRTVSSQTAAVTKPLRLLYIEHDRDDAELCFRALKGAGLDFEMETVATQEELVRKLRDDTFDVALADYRLPGWTGVDVLALIKQLGLDLPLILVTGTLGDALAVECFKLGVTDYVLKDQLGRLPMAIHRAQEEKALRKAEKRAVEALRESEARFRGIVDNAAYGIYWVTIGGEILHANPAFVQMLGYESVQELSAMKNSENFFRDPDVRKNLVGAFLKSGRVDARVEWKRKDGRIITVRLNGRRITDPTRPEVCIETMVEDITEKLALEKQLVQAQKFEGIGQLAGGIAHDFNNMIGAILGWADLGSEEAEPGSRLHRHFEKVRQQADRAAALTRQLLAFARRQILEPRNMDLNHTVTETLSLLEKIIGSNIEIKTKLAPDLSAVRADPTQLEQVLMNLCINARDAMPGGGCLTIETSNTSFDERYCATQPFAHPGRYVMLSVSDTGTGMDAVTLDRIFEPFFTTKEVGKGTGLGLATAYGVTRQHGGFVQVYSEVGLGSRFCVFLPFSSASPDAASGQPEDSAPVRGGTETVLIVEDHEGLREIARETLESQGYTVVLATDGEQAVREFQSRRNQIDLVLLDVVLPKLNGPEAYARICAVKPQVPVIFATGYSPDIALLEKVQQQGLPVLQKPYAPQDLARKVRETLDQHARLISRD